MPYTLCKHGNVIVQINKYLLIGWCIESLMAVFAIYEDNFGTLDTSTLWIVWDTLDEIFFVTFLYIIFRLKSLQIYMDQENKTEVQIKSKLRQLTRLKLGYNTVYIVIVIN